MGTPTESGATEFEVPAASVDDKPEPPDPHPPRLLQPSMRSHIDARIATTPRLPDPPATRDARRYRTSSTLPQASQSAAGRQVPRRTTQAQRQRAMCRAPPSSSAPPILRARPPLASHRRSRAAGAGQTSRCSFARRGLGGSPLCLASPVWGLLKRRPARRSAEQRRGPRCCRHTARTRHAQSSLSSPI